MITDPTMTALWLCALSGMSPDEHLLACALRLLDAWRVSERV